MRFFAPLRRDSDITPVRSTIVSDDALRDAVRRAVLALVPVLPVEGSPRRGYCVSGHLHLRGGEDEVRAACEAVCRLWELV